MATCKKCGKRGLFLKLNNFKICAECEKHEADNFSKAYIEKKKVEENERQRELEYRQNHDEYGHQIGDLYTFVPIRVAGVTYKNSRRNRQTILRNIYWKDEPYKRIDKDKCIELVPTLYDNNAAVEVWVYCKTAREQIGYIPKEEAVFFSENADRLHSCFGFQVNGGGIRSDGEELNFGATFTARFFNKPGQGSVNEELYYAFLNMQNSNKNDSGDVSKINMFKYFLRQYPNAIVDGWCPEDDNNGIIVYISGKPLMVVRRNPQNEMFSIHKYSVL